MEILGYIVGWGMFSLVMGYLQYRVRNVEIMITEIHNHLSAIRETNRLARLIVDDIDDRKDYERYKKDD